MDDEGASDSDGVEATGKTVEEAVENGLAELGLERHEVTVEVLSQGRGGLFGIGGEPARVRLVAVSFETPAGDEVAFAQEALETLLRLMNIEGSCTVRAPETPGDGVGLVKAVLDINGEDLGVLIGRRGGTMASLQYLLNLMVTRKVGEHAPYGVDVEGYRRRREESLRELAFRMAERVRETGKSVTLEPMPANERRIVHLALAKDPTVGTSSVGEGESRKVAIGVRR
ncbi:MAG: RNA-binding cell elongation regulator Jag/EloR [Dehalococcoidia bacterium]|nr:RNA-binding cell elongation regulator Jag/EloR [Dehalococcoidia bacterium]